MIEIKGDIFRKEEMLLRLGSSSTPDALLAAATLAQISISGEMPTSVETVLPSFVVSEKDPISQVEGVTLTFGKKPNTLKAFISLEEARKFIFGDLLANLALARAFKLEISSSLEDNILASRRPLPNIDSLGQLHKDTVITARTSEVLRRLQDGGNIALIGQSASGKTITAAQVSTSLITQGWTVSWLELSEPERNHMDLLMHFVRTPRGKVYSHLIVLDDIQSNPSEAIRIFQLITHLKSMTNSKLVLLIVGWDTAANLIKEAFQNVLVIPCQGEELLVPISRAFLQDSLNEETLEQIRYISGGDLLIAKQAFKHLEVTGKIPSRREIAASAYMQATANSALSQDAVRLLYQLSALGQFEIEASRTFAEGMSTKGLHELLELKIVRPNGEFLSVGHRSLANMFVFHLYNTRRKELEDLQTPVKLAVEYLRRAGNKQILATLELLDLAGHNLAQMNQHGTAFLVRAWSSFRILVSYLAKQVKNDPSWGDNIASAVFAAEAFAEISHDEWFSTANIIRSRWNIPNNGNLPTPINRHTVERVDFDEIYKRMKAEDILLGLDSTKGQGADTIDLDRFHRTWILGVLLGFEGAARQPDYQILGALKHSASVAIEPEGAFYPSRVPWITARVVLGLCSAGESIRSSDIIRKACDWLRKPYPEGPYRLGVWESGTGTWNTNLMTTAMCVTALVRSGVSINDNAVIGGIAYLLGKRSDWIRPGKEIDGALAMEAILLVKGRWREISRELSYILSWASDREPWAHTHLLASDSQDESSKVPFIASALIGIVWETVKTELPLLFEGLSIDVRGADPIFEETNDFNHFISTLRECLNEVKRRIEENVADREKPLSTTKSNSNIELKTQLNLWRERAEKCHDINLSIESLNVDNKYKDSNLRNTVIKALDQLGEECIGKPWVSVEIRMRRVK